MSYNNAKGQVKPRQKEDFSQSKQPKKSQKHYKTRKKRTKRRFQTRQNDTKPEKELKKSIRQVKIIEK